MTNDGILSGEDDLQLFRRSGIQELKLNVHTAQILERIAVRTKTLESLLNEELDVSTKLSNIGNRPGSYELESMLERRISDIERERRVEDLQCWRDLTFVMRDFMSVLEVLNAAKTKEKVLGLGGSGTLDERLDEG